MVEEMGNRSQARLPSFTVSEKLKETDLTRRVGATLVRSSVMTGHALREVFLKDSSSMKQSFVRK